jgi:hypothetical protein
MAHYGGGGSGGYQLNQGRMPVVPEQGHPGRHPDVNGEREAGRERGEPPPDAPSGQPPADQGPRLPARL